MASTASIILNTYYAFLNLRQLYYYDDSAWEGVPDEVARFFGADDFENVRKKAELLQHSLGLIGYAAQAITVASNVLTDVILVSSHLFHSVASIPLHNIYQALEMLFDLGKPSASDSLSGFSLLLQYK
ncbi:hypothetical protein PM082_023852 [Marasmius tenuissimus]|nr:hypothetical protein PM082_023852 [Marasmius tenuissimus]